MANQIPLSAGVNAAGGYLIAPQLASALQVAVARESALMQLADVQRINTSAKQWPVYLGRPTAAFVAEAGTKGTVGAEFGQLTANVKKIATGVRYTEEVLEDARINPQVLINPDVEAAIADLVDYHAIGTHVGAANTTATFSTSFDAAIANTTQTVELGSGADAMATAFSAAMALLEANGYGTNLSILAGYGLKAHLRDARQGGTLAPLYLDSFNSSEMPRFFGLPIAFSTNVSKTDAGVYAFSTPGLVGGAGSPPKTVAIVGDFSHAKVVLRQDINVRKLDQATYGGVNLAETNQIVLVYEMRVGFQVFDPSRAFVRIINAA